MFFYRTSEPLSCCKVSALSISAVVEFNVSRSINSDQRRQTEISSNRFIVSTAFNPERTSSNALSACVRVEKEKKRKKERKKEKRKKRKISEFSEKKI